VTCEKYQKLLLHFNANELAENERSKVRAHLRRCSTCRKLLSSLRHPLTLPSRTRGQAHSTLASSGDWYSSINTSIGKIWVGCSTHGISLISLGPNSPAEFESYYQRRLHRHVHQGVIPKSYADAVRKAIAGKKGASVPLDLSALSSFERTILHCLEQIPLGEVRAYNWLAKECGRPKAVRAVGTVMARNPIPFLLPCHRVTPAGGGVGNYGYGSALKRELLKKEGVPVDELDLLARSGIRFIGCRSTNTYCYPVCRTARRIRIRDRVPLRTIEEAHQAGFHSCPHCRPE
jgi:methylated-DNA-[protein]-cysteine S-methyltransferase